MLRSFALVTVLAVAAASPLHAQPRVAITPFAGGYFPVGNVLDQELFQGRTINEIGHEAGFLFGGRLGVRFSKLGIEAEGGYAPGSVDILQAPGDPTDVDQANVFFGSLNVTYDIFQAPFSPIAIFVSGGAGIVSRSGTFYDFFDDTTDLAGVAGLGLRVGLGPLATVRLDVRDYISSVQPSRGTVERDSKLQNDFLATVGLEIGFVPTP